MNDRLVSTPTLHDLERWLAAEIVAAEPRSSLDSILAPPPRGAAAERLSVYAAGYPARVADALAEAYPAVAHMAGDGAFHRLAQRFTAAVPLRAYNLNDAGAALPAFLRRDRLTADLPFLPDLAQLEWCVARAFHAREQSPFDPAAVASWSLQRWQAAVLRFQPAVALVRSEWPIRELWEARDVAIEQIDIDLRGRGDRVLVHRRGYAVVCESLDEPAAALLDLLLAGRPLESAVESLANAMTPAPAITAWFGRWMAAGLVIGCD